MAVAEKSIANNQFGTYVVIAVKAAIELICPWVACPKNIMSTVEQYAQKLADDAKAVQLAQVKCASGLLAYTEGMLCFACEVNWERFLNNETKVIKLAQRSCDDINAECSPVFASVAHLMIDAQDLILKITQELTGFKLNFNISKVPDMCGGTLGKPGDCSKYLCHTLLDGFRMPTLSWNGKGPARRLQAAQPGSRAAVEAVMGAAARQLQGDLLTALHASVTGPARRLTESLASASSGGAAGGAAAPSSSSASTGHNEYVASGGYDAYGAGCADTNSCPAPQPAPTPFPAWATALIVIACVSVAAAVGFVVYRRRRDAAASDPMRSRLVSQP